MNLKFKSKLLSIAVSTVLTFSTCTSVGAHPGRTDSNGGHYVRTAGWGYPVGSYHYHNGGPAYEPSTVYNYVENTKKIQQKLNELGYSCGVADGIMGTKTRNAIKNFQKDHGLTVDGIVGSNTTKHLFE